MCRPASVSLYGQPPTRSAPISRARRNRASVPGDCNMPSWANAQSWSSTAGAYSRLSASSACRPSSPTIGSTSTCARMAVVPAATARSNTRRARAPMSAVVKPRFATPVRRIASAAVSAEPDTRSTSSALSRWMCASTRPGVTTRPATSTVSRAASAARPTDTMRPSAIARSTGSAPVGRRQDRRMRSSTPGPPRASPTSAVRGGQGRSFGHLGKKSALHFGRSGDGRRHAQALREIEPEPIEEGGLRGVRAHDAAQTEFAAVLGGEHDVGALDAAELVEDRPWTLPEAGPPLPLLEGFPQHVGQEADEDVGLDAILPLVPHGTNPQLTFLDAECRLRVGELDVRAPQVLGRPVGDVGAQHVAPFAPTGPVVPFRTRRPLQPHAGPARRVGHELDDVAAGRPLVLFEQAPDLALQAPNVERAAGLVHAPPQPR